MNPLLAQKSNLIALVLLVVGICFHIRGRNLSTDQTAQVQQGLGLLFDVLAGMIPYFKTLHMSNAQNIQDNRTVINATSPAGNLPPVPGTQEVSPTAQQSLDTTALAPAPKIQT